MYGTNPYYDSETQEQVKSPRNPNQYKYNPDQPSYFPNSNYMTQQHNRQPTGWGGKTQNATLQNGTSNNHIYQNQGIQPLHYENQIPPPVTVVNVSSGKNESFCAICRMNTETYAVRRSGGFVWLMCLLLFLLTCCCFWIAFWVDDWKDLQFRCRRCGHIKYVNKGGF